MFCICLSHNQHILDCMIHWYLNTCLKWIHLISWKSKTSFIEIHNIHLLRDTLDLIISKHSTEKHKYTREAKAPYWHWLDPHDNQDFFIWLISKSAKHLGSYDPLISQCLKQGIFDFNILWDNMSIPGKQMHHFDIELGLIIIWIFYSIRFRINPFVFKWSIDIFSLHSLGWRWTELLIQQIKYKYTGEAKEP